MSRGYIYIIDPSMKIDGQTVLKIGFTTRRPSQRLRELQTSHPHPLHMVHVSEFPNAKMAEAWLHNALSDRKVRGGGGTEFFCMSHEEAISLVNSLAYRVSREEAEKALERDLDKFRDQVSGELSFKFALIFGLIGLIFSVVSVLSEAGQVGSIGSVAAGTIFGILLGGPIGLLSSFIGMAIGDVVVRLIWKKAISAERIRLFDKYPAAKDIGRARRLRRR